MRIIVTDTGLIWNHKNPMLKKCRDAVMVVCLNGKKSQINTNVSFLRINQMKMIWR